MTLFCEKGEDEPFQETSKMTEDLDIGAEGSQEPKDELPTPGVSHAPWDQAQCVYLTRSA